MLVVAVAGCASTPPAPVEDRSLGGHHGSRRGASAVGVYRVRSGDTLYSIAFRNGLDFRELARSNRIEPPFTIYPGQEIRLDGRPPVRGASTSTPPRTVSPSPTAPPKPSTSGVVTVSKPPSAVVASGAAPQPVAPARAPVPDSATNANLAWRWPAEGQLVASFVNGDQTRQGINIAGKSGDPVRATADGEVVYSGNGLIGYGELIIVKHSSTLLSAYGHNRRRLVQEGDKVKGGQQIAEMGSSSATRDMVHFEIRVNGKPVDPLGFLPRR